MRFVLELDLDDQELHRVVLCDPSNEHDHGECAREYVISVLRVLRGVRVAARGGSG